MNIEPYLLTVYRRGHRMWVSPSVRTPDGFESLPGAIAVAEPSQLATSLHDAAAQVRSHADRPNWSGDPFFIAAGATSWEEFVEGLVAVNIMRTAKETRISLGVRKNQSLVAAAAPVSYPADLPFADVARISLALLDGHAT